MHIEYSKTREWAKSPERANPSDAGIDLFYCPLREPKTEIPGHGRKAIPPESTSILETGIKFSIPHGYCLRVLDRSSWAADSIVVGGGVIDAGYEGEIKVVLHNLSDSPFRVSPGEKIAQAVLTEIEPFGLKEVAEEKLYENVPVISERGSDGFGSTD